MNCCGDRSLVAAGLNGDTCARRQIGQPPGLRCVLDILELGDEMMPGAAVLKIEVAVALEIGGTGEQAETQRADAANDQVVLIGTFQSQRDVRLAHGQAEFTGVGDQLDHELGLLQVQGGKAWRQDVRRHGLRAGHPYQSCHAGVPAAYIALERQGLDFQPLGPGTNAFPRLGLHIPVGCPVQQSYAQAGLKGGKPAAHGGLRDVKVLGGCGKAAVPGQS